MTPLPASLSHHRVKTSDLTSVLHGEVRWAPAQSLWFTGMFLTALIGGVLLFSWSALLLFVVSTGVVLLFGHSLGSHRKLIHDSFQCPRWLARLLVWFGVQVGLSGSTRTAAATRPARLCPAPAGLPPLPASWPVLLDRCRVATALPARAFESAAHPH